MVVARAAFVATLLAGVAAEPASAEANVLEALSQEDACGANDADCALSLRQLRGEGVLSGVHAHNASSTPRRLRIKNGCPTQPLWIAHMAAGTSGPDPQDVEIAPGKYHDFQTPDNLKATRYWPKMGCDSSGKCTLGDSGGPGEGCVKHDKGYDDYSDCAPPVDTKFEASFGVNGQPCNPQAPGGVEMKGCDFVDISLVDGYTLPVKLEFVGGQCTDSRSDAKVDKIDCTDLSLSHCPKAEVLSGKTMSLGAVNPIDHQVKGCYSPCSRMLDTKWIKQAEISPSNAAAAPYCCPTPPISPDQCRTGPIKQTEYLQVIASKCKGAYSYAYDDQNGLLRCTSATQYVLTYYCPS